MPVRAATIYDRRAGSATGMRPRQVEARPSDERGDSTAVVFCESPSNSWRVNAHLAATAHPARVMVVVADRPKERHADPSDKRRNHSRRCVCVFESVCVAKGKNESNVPTSGIHRHRMTRKST